MQLKRFIYLLVFFPTLSGCGYNQMVSLQEGVDAQWHQVENVYQRRADLIPNLVGTVKGYADFEQETLTAVVEARSKASSVTVDASTLNESTLQQFQNVQTDLGNALSRLMVVVERYPDLKANENFMQLQVQLEGTENRIATERRKYNESVQAYNTYVRKFPKNIVAGLFGFDSKPYFTADEGARRVPEVKF